MAADGQEHMEPVSLHPDISYEYQMSAGGKETKPDPNLMVKASVIQMKQHLGVIVGHYLWRDWETIPHVLCEC